MEPQKHHKPLIVLLANTLSNPNTVVVELRHTHITGATVFRAGWFDDETGLALLILCIENVVVIVFEPLYVELLVLSGNLTWTDCTGSIVDVEAESGKGIRNIDVNHPYVPTGHMQHNALDLIKHESALNRCDTRQLQ